METTVFYYLYKYVTSSEWRCLLGDLVPLDARELAIRTASMLAFCEKICAYRGYISTSLIRHAPYAVFTSQYAKPYLDEKECPYQYREVALHVHTRTLILCKRPMRFVAYYVALNKIIPKDDPDGFMYKEAIRTNNIAMINWLLNPTTGGGIYPYSTNVAKQAIVCGYWHILHKIRMCCYIWRYQLCFTAAKCGQLGILQWLQNLYHNKSRLYWDKEACLQIAQSYGHVKTHAWIERQPA